MAFAREKKKPVIEPTEWFGPGLGLDGGPVMSERPEETLESGVETERGGTCSPVNRRQRAVPLRASHTPRCPRTAVSAPAGTARGGRPGKPCLASCPGLLARGGHPGWERHKRKPRKSAWLRPQRQELLPGTRLGPTPPPSTSRVAVPHAANSFNQRRKTLRTQDSNPPGKVTDSPILQRGSLNIKNSIVVLAALI